MGATRVGAEAVYVCFFIIIIFSSLLFSSLLFLLISFLFTSGTLVVVLVVVLVVLVVVVVVVVVVAAVIGKMGCSTLGTYVCVRNSLKLMMTAYFIFFLGKKKLRSSSEDVGREGSTY